jgi:large subunit ribosomal protein L21
MYAIVRTGGKQVKVAPGDVLRIETPSGDVEKGKEITLSEIVFVGGREGKKGTDASGVSVKATVLGPVKTRKVLVFKKKRTKQYRRTKGHRQSMIDIRIDAIEG